MLQVVTVRGGRIIFTVSGRITDSWYEQVGVIVNIVSYLVSNQ